MEITLQDMILIFLYLNVNMSVFYVDQQEFLDFTRKQSASYRGCFYCQAVLFVNTFVTASHFIVILIIRELAGEKIAVASLLIVKVLHFPLYIVLYIIKKIESIF